MAVTPLSSLMVASAKSKAASKRKSTASAEPLATLKATQPSRARGKAQAQPPAQATQSIVAKLLAQSDKQAKISEEQVATKPSRALVWGTASEPNFSGDLFKEAERVANETISCILNEDLKKNDELSMLELYRLSPSHPGLSSTPPTAHPVRQYDSNIGWDDCLASELGFSSPFEAVNLTDKQCILKKTEAQMVQKALGEHPMSRKRKQGVPAGLKNLGATCYMNSLLQYLFFNPHFRSLMLKASSQVPAILELQRVFALLLKGEQKTVDPTKFVEAAAINASEEADATEFSALLLDFLDQALKGESSSLFKGELSKVMTCQENLAHRSSKVETFEELRAGVVPQANGASTVNTTVVSPEGKVQEGLACLQGEKFRPKKNTFNKKKVQLEQLLQDTSFADEVFDGDNLYACELCNNKKVVAKQTVNLSKAPPYLHVRFERYKFDTKKNTRTKLNLVISFPKALQLRVKPEGQEVSDVIYDCIGYLEHVSDSAHSGHYTATLFHEDAGSENSPSEQDKDDIDGDREVAESDAMAGSSSSSLVTSESNAEQVKIGASAGGVATSMEPPQKKRRVGARKGAWWKMDDSTVGRVQWMDCTTGEAQALSDDTPQRITSASAYLLLYRRRDYSVEPEMGQHGEALPANLEAFLEGHNSSFQQEQAAYQAHDAQLQSFATRRLQEVEALRVALLKTPRGLSASDYLVVPNAWLRAYMKGEDYKDASPLRTEGQTTIGTCFKESFFKAQPPLHQPILLPRRHVDGSPDEEVLDPLAVWCGEVVLLPKKAVNDVRLGSQFRTASELLCPMACEKARRIWSCWSEEFKALERVEGSRVIAADLRVQPNNQILLADTVWISRKTWTRFSKLVAKATSKIARWKLFLEETSALRWGSCSGEKDEDIDTHDNAENQLDGSKTVDESASASAQASSVGIKDLFLYEGILCDHGKVNKPKAAFLVPRVMMEDLLKCAREKEMACQAHWGNCRGLRRLRTGHREQRIIASDEVCEICCPEWASHFANPTRHCRKNKQVETCSLFLDGGGSSATPRTIEVPWEDGRKMTGSWLRKVAAAKAGCELRALYIVAGKGEPRLLKDDDVMESLPAALRARVRSDTTPEPEGDAFLRSVFVTGRR